MEFKNDMLLAVMVGIVIGCFLNPITAVTLIFMYIFTKNEQLPGNMYPREVLFNIAFNVWLIANRLVRKPIEVEKITESQPQPQPQPQPLTLDQQQLLPPQHLSPQLQAQYYSHYPSQFQPQFQPQFHPAQVVYVTGNPPHNIKSGPSPLNLLSRN